MIKTYYFFIFFILKKEEKSIKFAGFFVHQCYDKIAFRHGSTVRSHQHIFCPEYNLISKPSQTTNFENF